MSADAGRGESVYFGTPASGTQIMGLSMTTVAKISMVVLVGMAVVGLGSPTQRVLVGVVLVLVTLAVAAATIFLQVHPLAWVKMQIAARLRRRTRGVICEGGLLMSRGTHQLVGGVSVVGDASALSLRARPDEADAWSQLLNEASNRLLDHGEMILRSAIIPHTLVEDLTQCSATYRALALESYRVATTLLMVAPPGSLRSRRVALSRAITGVQMLTSHDRLNLAPPERPEDLLNASCGCLSTNFSHDGVVANEHVDMLVGEGFVASTYRVTGWPGRSVDPRALLPLFAPGPPSRIVSLVARPVEAARAQRHVARHRTEMVADRRLRRERGYLDRARDEHREVTALTQEEELLAGFRLCRYQLLVVLLAPSPQRLVGSRTALENVAASAQLRLSIGLGEQRSLFERALMGANGWS